MAFTYVVVSYKRGGRLAAAAATAAAVAAIAAAADAGAAPKCRWPASVRTESHLRLELDTSECVSHWQVAQRTSEDLQMHV